MWKKAQQILRKTLDSTRLLPEKFPAEHRDVEINPCVQQEIFFDKQVREKFKTFSRACQREKRKILLEKSARTSLYFCFIIFWFTSRKLRI